MKKLISLALAIVMIMCLGTTAFAATAEAPGDYTADVTGSYVAGNESNAIVYCVDITWSDLDFTYHAEKGAVWDPDTLKYSEVEPAYWEGEGTITVSNRSNTKITAAPKYAPAEGYGNAGMDFSTSKLKVASAAESGTAQTGTITVTPNGFLPAMDEADTIGTITLTIAQDADVTVAELTELADEIEQFIAEAKTNGAYAANEAEFVRLQQEAGQLTDMADVMESYMANGTWSEDMQQEANSCYEDALEQYDLCKELV